MPQSYWAVKDKITFLKSCVTPLLSLLILFISSSLLLSQLLSIASTSRVYASLCPTAPSMIPSPSDWLPLRRVSASCTLWCTGVPSKWGSKLFNFCENESIDLKLSSHKDSVSRLCKIAKPQERNINFSYTKHAINNVVELNALSVIPLSIKRCIAKALFIIEEYKKNILLYITV